MTPEETAREIVETTIVEMLTTDDRETWIATVATAIRDAYERAAQLAEKRIDIFPAGRIDFEELAADIRALKGEG